MEVALDHPLESDDDTLVLPVARVLDPELDPDHALDPDPPRALDLSPPALTRAAVAPRNESPRMSLSLSRLDPRREAEAELEAEAAVELEMTLAAAAAVAVEAAVPLLLVLPLRPLSLTRSK